MICQRIQTVGVSDNALPTRQVRLSRPKLLALRNVDPRDLADTIPPMGYQQIPNLGDLNIANF